MPERVDRVVERIIALPATSASAPVLAAMLDESADHFCGLSMGDAEWVRANIYAALGRNGRWEAASDALLEDMDTSYNPLILAGIARAIAGGGTSSSSSSLRLQLDRARERIVLRDRYVTFAGVAEVTKPRTACAEIDIAIASLAPASETCCAHEDQQAPLTARVTRLCPTVAATIDLEDQDGERMSLPSLLAGRETLIAFFYTRCMNPEKCSLTVSRFGRLSQMLERDPALGELSLLLLTYDPNFDTAERLKGYGTDRGFIAGNRARIARCRQGQSALLSLLGARVGFGPSTVNAHGRDLFVVRPNLTVVTVELGALESSFALSRELTALCD
jgi:SCO1/SenC